jgi:pimeloyl-ACP methyl ester carboxylesterase
MDSPDQGAYGIPVSAIILEEDELTMKVAAIGGQYKGTIDRPKNQLKGTWVQGGNSFNLDLKRVEKLEKPNRPQTPEPPFDYLAEDVSFPNKEAGHTLAGTLTLPASGLPIATAVMITGSGPQDRDETIFQHKPFAVIADHLAKNGIAVLRFDDRGVGESGGSSQFATSADFATDVRAAVNFLKDDKRIDAGKIGLIGHSEGGLIAPMVAEDGDIAFIVSLAGPGIRGAELLVEQQALIMRAQGSSEELIALNYRYSGPVLKFIADTPDSAAAAQKIKDFRESFRASLTTKERVTAAPILGSDSQMEQGLRQVLSPWFRYFLAYDPAPAWSQTNCPVLALNGTLDLQVPATDNLQAIEAALLAGKNPPFEGHALGNLNHLFQKATTGSVLEYGKIETTIEPKVLKLISDWITKTAGESP